MPSWKKVIISGSNASLSSLFVTNAVTSSIVSASQFTGSLFGTASWARNVVSASGLNKQIQYNNNGILTGSSGLTWDDITKQFVVFGQGVMQGTSGITLPLRVDAFGADGLYIGQLAGEGIFSANADQIIASFDTNTGIYYYANGYYYYDGINHNIIGDTLITGSLNTTGSVLFRGLTTSQSVTNVVTINPTTGQLYYTASAAFGGGSSTPAFPFIGNAVITGSLVVSGTQNGLSGITGSLFGTASWATNSLTASTALTASSADNFIVRGNLIVSGNTTIGDVSTDTITMNAATMSLGSGTGVLNIDSNTLYVDGANNRVGIGLNNPSYSLDIAGPTNIKLSNTDYTNSSGSNSHLRLQNTNGAGQTVISFTEGNLIRSKIRSDYIGGTTYVSYGNQGYHLWYTNGDFGIGSPRMVICNSGNVQIGGGTTDNGYKLQVDGDIKQETTYIDSRNVTQIEGNTIDVVTFDGSVYDGFFGEYTIEYRLSDPNDNDALISVLYRRSGNIRVSVEWDTLDTGEPPPITDRSIEYRTNTYSFGGDPAAIRPINTENIYFTTSANNPDVILTLNVGTYLDPETSYDCRVYCYMHYRLVAKK